MQNPKFLASTLRIASIESSAVSARSTNLASLSEKECHIPNMGAGEVRVWLHEPTALCVRKNLQNTWEVKGGLEQ